MPVQGVRIARKMINPLVSPATYLGWVFAFVGAVASLPPLLVAVLAAPPGRPAALRVAGFALGFGLVVVAMALPRATRIASVRLADHLLDAHLPAPVEPTRARHTDRLRTSAWLVVHMVVGGTITAVTGLCVLTALALPGVWLGDGGEVDVLWFTLNAPHGLGGVWTLLAAAGSLAAAGYFMGGATAVLRRLAPAFLGHGPAERLAAAEERMNALAQRNRLAQDLHDSIGHTLTASTIQAAVALELMDRDPEAARRALGSIEQTSRAAMDDLDHVIGVLRQGSQAATSTRPQPTLAGLGSLTGLLRRSGAELTMKTTG